MKMRVIPGAVLGHALSFVRYRDKRDPVADFIRLRRNEKIPAAKNGSVMVLPIRLSPYSNLFEGLIGYAFRLRGYRAAALMCGKSLNYCDHISCIEKKMLACPLCLYEQKRFSSAFGLEDAWFDELISDERKRELEHLALSVPLSEISQYSHTGVHIGIHVFSAVQRYTLSSEPDIQENESLFREFFLSALKTVESMRAAIALYRPPCVISSHGVYSTWGPAIETAISEGVRCVTWGRDYIGGQIVAALDSSYLLANMMESNAHWEKKDISPQQRERTLQYFRSKRDPESGVDCITYYSKKSAGDKESLLEKLNLRPERRRLGFYPSILWDAQTFTASAVFPKVIDWVRCTLEWIKQNPDVDLIIRAHPAEQSRIGNKRLETFELLLKEICPQYPPNVRFINAQRKDISSYDVSEICEASLMYGSTIGLELAVVGHPVISAGRIHWSNKGIMFDVESIEHYKTLLEAAASGNLKMPEEMKERAIKYAHYWIFEKHMPETLINHRSLVFTGYKINSSMDLGPGENAVIDKFIDCCLTGEPFIWD